MSDYFSYNPGNLPAGHFRISASQLSRFFDSTSQWFREFLLGEAPAFSGSTASNLGTCVHAAAAMYADSAQVDYTAIQQFISTLPSDIDKAEITAQLTHMVPSLISGYLSANRHTHSEEFISYEVLPGIHVGGSIDAYDERIGLVVDYKTTSGKIPSSFPRPYYFQLLVYAWVLRKLNRPITQLRLVYTTRYVDGGFSEKTGKPLKSYPSETSVLNHLITQSDWDLIDGCINLIAHSVHTWNTNPELRYLLMQDYRYKLPDKPMLFKD